MAAVKRKNKGGVEVKPFQIKNHLWVFINCLIENPTFDSQTKENMTLRSKAFGSTCDFSEKFIKQVCICIYIISSVMHVFWLVLTYDLLEDRCIDDVIIKTFFNSLLYKTNRFQVAMHLFSNRSQRTSKCSTNISDTLSCASCATFLFLPHFYIICDLLLNRRMATWNLYVNLFAITFQVVFI